MSENSGKFKAGHKGHKPKLSEDQKIVKKLTRDQFIDMASLLVKKSWPEIAAIANRQEGTGFQVFLAECLVKGHERGDWGMFDKLLDRLIGKAKDDVQVTYLRRILKKRDGSTVEFTNGPIEDDEE